MRILTCAIATLLLSCGSNFPLEGEIITEVETEESETTEEGETTEEDNDTETSSEGTTEATTTTETDTFDSSDSETDSDSNNSNSETTTNSDSEENEYSYEECEETSDCEPFGLGVTCLKVSYPPNSSICTMLCPQAGNCESEECGCPEMIDGDVVCRHGYCLIACDADNQCPEEMVCVLGVPEISGLCFWSSSAP